MLKLSASIETMGSLEQFKSTAKMMRAAGLDGVDFGLFRKNELDMLNAMDWEAKANAIREIAEQNGLEIAQCHSPFNPYNLGNPEKSARVIHDIKKSFQFVHALGAKYTVVHPMRPQLVTDPNYGNPEVFHRWNVEMYKEMVDLAAACDVTVCTENIFTHGDDMSGVHGFSSKAEDMIRVMDEVPGLTICFDIGHAYLVKEDPCEMIRAYGSRLKLLHLHGNDGRHDLHVAPMELNNIDWAAFGHTLKEIGYEGSINLEVLRPFDNAPACILPTAFAYIGACAKYIAEQVR